MPPKTKINETMILDAAFEMIRREGIEKLTVRSISVQLKCSTQPILYHFSSIEDIKREVYNRVNQYHSAYIMPRGGSGKNPLMEMGLHYIKFGYEEKKLFQFLFQTNQFTGFRMDDLIESQELGEIINLVSSGLDIGKQAAKEVFLELFITVHGCASLLANNAMEYEEERFEHILQNVCGTIMKSGSLSGEKERMDSFN